VSPGVTNPDGSITYTVTTTDPDNDLRIYNVTTPPAHGVLVFNGDSAYTYTRSTLDADSFTLTVIDEHGGTATATVDIAARVNDDPTITVTPGTRNTTNGSIKYTVTTTDPDGDAVTVTFTDPAHGSVVANGDGTFTYTPDRAYAHSLGVGGSEPDPFTFTATDAWGATATEDASPLLKFLNQRPIMAINLTNEDPITGVITGQVTLSDPDGDPVIYQLHRLQRQGVVKDKGTLEFNETTGVFTFTPNAAARAAAVAPDAGFFDQTVTLEIAVTDGPAVINTGISLTIYPPTI
jgi:VCBS repeat-containing protein